MSFSFQYERGGVGTLQKLTNKPLECLLECQCNDYTRRSSCPFAYISSLDWLLRALYHPCTPIDLQQFFSFFSGICDKIAVGHSIQLREYQILILIFRRSATIYYQEKILHLLVQSQLSTFCACKLQASLDILITKYIATIN